MGLEEVKNDILAEAERQASIIVKDAENEAAKIIADAEAQAKEMSLKFNAKLKLELQNHEKKDMSLAMLDAKKEISQTKKQLLLQTMEDAKARLVSMQKKDKEKLLKQIYAKAEKSIEIAIVYCAAHDEKMVKDMMPSTVKVSASTVLGGIIAENADRSIRLDYSYNALVEDLYNKKLNELVESLF